MAYDKNVDYAALAKAAALAGDTKAANQYLNQRQEKIDAMGLAGKTASNNDLLAQINAQKQTAQVTQPVNQPMQVVQPMIQPMQPQFDISGFMNQLKQAQTQAQTARLGKVRDQALSTNAAEQAQVAPRYYEQKRQAIGTNQASARNFADYLAQRGLQSSGLAAQGEINRNVSLNNAVGNLNAQEAQTLDSLARQRSDIQSNYLSDLEAAQSGIESDALQRGLDEYNRQQDIARQNEQIAYSRQQDAIGNFQNTLGAYSNDYQAQINKVQNDGDLSNDWQIPYLQSARQQKLQEIAQQEAAQKAAALKAQQEAQKQALDNYYRQQELLLKQQQTKYNTSKPYYNPNTGKKTSNLSLDW